MNIEISVSLFTNNVSSNDLKKLLYTICMYMVTLTLHLLDVHLYWVAWTNTFKSFLSIAHVTIQAILEAHSFWFKIDGNEAPNFPWLCVFAEKIAQIVWVVWNVCIASSAGWRTKILAERLKIVSTIKTMFFVFHTVFAENFAQKFSR